MISRRVAITGVGIVSPHSNDVRSTFNALLDGKSAVRELFLESDVGSLVVAGASSTLAPSYTSFTPAVTATADKISLFALYAAKSAIDDAGLDLSAENPERVGVAAGTSLGGTISQEGAYQEVFKRGKSRLSPFTLVRVMYNGPAAQIAMQHGLEGPSITHSTTCSSSSVSIGESMRTIRHGYADVMIAGGSEALFSYVSIKAWQALQVLALPRDKNVSGLCKPFSLDRNGTVLGDGAAFVVLEEFDRAKHRGARIYAELAGYGVCSDSGHLTQPSVSGQCRAMTAALEDANLAVDQVDYINAHGTGTQVNDVTETRAIQRAFGSHSFKMAVSSTKSMHGHLVGAAGALELIVATMALSRGAIPPTAHLTLPDPDCNLDYVPNFGRKSVVRAALSNTFAVGGTAAVLAIRQI